MLITSQLREQVATHTDWLHSDQSQPEPTNPWPQVVEQIVAEIKHVPVGWGSHSEIVTDYIEWDYVGSFYEHIKYRYEMRPLHAGTVEQIMCKYVQLRELS